MVAAGIFLSKIAGLVRIHFEARFFGTSEVADAYRAALRIPNFLQNLFGEGVLSASFIPVYARLRAEKRDQEASQLAEAIFALLALTTSVLVALGIVFTPILISLIAPGFKGETRELTIHLVRILFPGVGLLVFSAWCLGVLNSHCFVLLASSYHRRRCPRRHRRLGNRRWLRAPVRRPASHRPAIPLANVDPPSCR
jgi:putative peptidoglycan lipid II flippase